MSMNFEGVIRAGAVVPAGFPPALIGGRALAAAPVAVAAGTAVGAYFDTQGYQMTRSIISSMPAITGTVDVGTVAGVVTVAGVIEVSSVAGTVAIAGPVTVTSGEVIARGPVDHGQLADGGPVMAGGVYHADPMAVTLADRSIGALQVDYHSRLRVVDEGGGSLPPFTHWSPADGAFAYDSAVTLDAAASFPFTVEDATCLVVLILWQNAAGEWQLVQNGSNGVSITSAADIVTVAGAGDIFEATDLVYGVGIIYQNKGFDAPTNSFQQTVINPVWDERDGSAQDLLPGGAQDFTGAWADLGAEIDCRGFNLVLVYLTLDINDSTNCRIRGLLKHTSAGAQEYDLPAVAFAAGVYAIAGPTYFEWDSDADQLTALPIPTNGASYLQLQIEAGAVGGTAGQIDAAYYTRHWMPLTSAMV